MGRILSQGSAGPEVAELQAALNFHVRRPATALAPDGRFGPLTFARVRDFQKRAGLGVDGLVGPDTIRALYRTIAGSVEVDVTRRDRTPLASAPRGQSFGVAQPARAALLAGVPQFGQFGPAIPDFIPPSQRVPQTRAATSESFDNEAKVQFDPFADPADGEKPLRLTLSSTLPWPIFLPAPTKLEIETTAPGVGQFKLDAKFKLPYKLAPTRRLELKPYFFTGAGMKQNHFEGLNAGAGGSVKLRLLENIGGSGVSVAVEADGGVKYDWNRTTGETKIKGFFEGSVTVEVLRF
jgi:peptidoglycan hydrolase-like protein with peptidoglycan-binding domain